MLKILIIFILIISAILTFINPNIIVNLQFFLANEKVLYIEMIISSIFLFIYYQRIFLGIKRSKLKKDNLLNIKKIKNNEVNYYREIPQQGNLNQIFWLALSYNIIKNKTNLIGAFIVKWLKEEKITINNKNEIILPTLSTQLSTNVEDQVLVNILYEASGENKILEWNELKKWIKRNRKRIKKYFNEIISCYNTMAIENGLIIKKGDKIYESKELRTKALQIVGFKKFILEYSLIRDRELQEVKIWEEYLVVAHLLGIAKKVRKNLKKIYPDMELSLNKEYHSIYEKMNFSFFMLWEFFLYLPISILGGIIIGSALIGIINIAFLFICLPARILTRKSVIFV